MMAHVQDGFSLIDEAFSLQSRREQLNLNKYILYYINLLEFFLSFSLFIGHHFDVKLASCYWAMHLA